MADSPARPSSDDLLGLPRSAGGVMTLGGAGRGLVALRGTSVEEPGERRRLASALVRVAYEAEQAKAEPRLHLRRSKAGLLLAASTGLADYAEARGRGPTGWRKRSRCR